MRVPEPEPHHLLAIFNAAPEAYLVLSPDLRIVLANDCYLHTFGLHREAWWAGPSGNCSGRARGRHAPGGRGHATFRGQLRQSRQPEAWPAGPYQPAGADGPARYGQVLNSPVPDGEGRLQYILHKVTPAPGPAAAEQPGADARPVGPEPQRKAEQVLDSFNAAFIEMDGEYRYRYLNPGRKNSWAKSGKNCWDR
jgi:PAS domain-containing protein